MHWGSRVVLAISLVVLFAVSIPMQVSAFGGDGNVTYEPVEKCTNTIDDDGNEGVNEGCNEICGDSINNDPQEDGTVNENPPCSARSCYDSANNNNHDGTDTDDLACVKPIGGQVEGAVKDRMEGNIWDTDLSQALGGPKSKGILFAGNVSRGSTTKTFDKADSSSSSSITEHYIDQTRAEGDGWAFGFHQEQTYTQSDFPGGTHFRNGRAIYPPNPIGSAACGDALENQDSQQAGVKGDTAGSGGITFCTEDYGQIYEKYHVKSPYGTDPSGSPGCGCSDSGSEQGPVYYASGDEVVEETEDCESSGDCDCTPQPNGPPSCDTDYSEDTDKNRHNCDSQHSTVSAFPDSGSGVRNDPARTYTEFTAYDSSSEAWCGYEFTTTVDADGPRGEGDGLVAIENRGSTNSILGTWAHDGADKVGERVFVDGSNMSARSEIDLSCPGQKEVCLKYVDLYTKDSGWTTSSGGNGYKSAIGIDYEVLTPDDGYSVCKMTNKVASNDGTEDRVVNCDYYRNGDPISPLNRACGDDPREKLLAAEGTEVSEDVMKEYLSYQQECFTYDRTTPPEDVDASDYDSSGDGGDPDDGIVEVDFNSIEKTSGIDTGDGYEDFTASGKTKVKRQNTYLVTVTIGQDSGGWYQNARVWFDWNQNNDLESNEGYNVGICAYDNCQVQTSVTVPADADKGATLMRVSEKYNDYPEPDEQMTYGEVEDYSVEIMGSGPNITENACVMDGKVYPEGSVLEVQDSRSRFYDFEKGGDSNDVEVCLGINDGFGDDIIADDTMGSDWLNVQDSSGDSNDQVDDNGGEWWDLDTKKATTYLRNNDVDSQEYRGYWRENPDKQADSSTGVTSWIKADSGFALEDDCASTDNKNSILQPYQGISEDCEDSGNSIGRQNPFYANFSEGAMDDDFNFQNTWLDVNLPNIHNRVQTGGFTGHGNEIISKTHRIVDTESEWEQGTTETDVTTSGGFLDSTESRSSKDFDGTLAGKDIYGLYVSRAYEKTPELRFSNLSIDYQFSGGDHPVVVQYSHDPDFSSGYDSQTFWLNSTSREKSFDLSAGPNHNYLRFKIGISTAPTAPQVAFTVDESGSMSAEQAEVQSEIKDFYRALGSNSEGVVVGSINGDVTPGTGLTSNTNDLETAAGNLQANGGAEAPEATVEKAVNYNNAGSEDYRWQARDSRAIIWVQSGGSSESCDGLNPGNNDVGDYLIDRRFSFYAIANGDSGCDTYYKSLASDTDGEYYQMASQDSNINFQPALDDITADLNTIPAISTVDKVNITSQTPPEPGPGNTQDDEPCWLATGPSSCSEENVNNRGQSLDELDNGEIDPDDDEWALTPSLKWGIANNGTAYPPGQCHGSPRVQGVDKSKEGSVYANSYVRATKDVWDIGYSEGDRPYTDGIDGNWINPDNTTLSATSGLTTCDLTGQDWGYAIRNNSQNFDCRRPNDPNEKHCRGEGVPTSSGTENAYRPNHPHVVQMAEDDLTFDVNSDPKTNFRNGFPTVGFNSPDYADFVGSFGDVTNLMGGEAESSQVGDSGDLDDDDTNEVVLQQKSSNDLVMANPDMTYVDTGVDSQGVGGIGDYDSDESNEVAYIESGSGNLMFTNSTGGTGSFGVQAAKVSEGAGDIDDDGSIEVAYKDTSTSELKIVDANGDVDSLGYTVSDIGGVGDIDDDGDQDIAVTGPNHNVRYYDYNGNYEIKNIEAMDVGGIGDVDGDGNKELAFIFGEYSGGTLSYSNYSLMYVEGITEPRGSGVFKKSVGGYGEVKNDNLRNLRQWPGACGDDRNEYLIREHAANYGGEYNPVLSSRDNIYVCADRPTDCAMNGEVYAEGQLVDVSDISDESGADSEDHEICIDANPSLPGGEWWDPDNEFIRSDIVGSGDSMDPENYVRKGDINENLPGKVFWHDGNRRNAVNEASNSVYSPIGGNGISYSTGYALEDDCDPQLTGVNAGCDDTGTDESQGTYPGLIYSPFRENKNNVAVKSDDHSQESTWAVRMYASGSYTHGSNTGQMSENTPGVNSNSQNWGWPTSNMNDSKIDSEEDTWAVGNATYDAVGPTGAIYQVGKCYGRNPPQHSEGWILKNETVMANSYASREDVNGDPRDEGNWVDPDTTFKSVSNGSLSCDLNSTDWGMGYNTSTGTDLETIAGHSREYGYNVTDRHAVTGPISFDMGQNPLGENQNDLQQYPNACGDDQQEHLIREQRTYRGNEIQPNLTHRENIYVCADRITDCGYNGYVFSEGQTADLSDFSPSHTDPEIGENISDEEVCLDLNKTTPGGEWYDKDQNLTVKGRILGLEDTFTDNEEPGFGNCDYEISGKVVGAPGYGDIVIGSNTTSLGANNRFSGTGIEMECGATKLIKYQRTGHVQAKKRVKLPNSGASLTDIVLSNNLMYQPTEVWSGIMKFQDHDFDRNPGTDWVRQGEKFERDEVSFFNRTHDRFNETGSRILDSSYTASNWGSGEPNDKDGSENGEEDCAAVRSSGDWNDQTCTDLIKGVCEFQDGSYAATAPRTWSVANRTCYSKGGHLAVVDSASENNMISSTYGHGWIGYGQTGSPSGTGDSWNWVNASGTYQPEAYATEDDCGPLLRKSGTAPCGDVGTGEQDGEWFSAGNYSFGGVQP